MMLKEPNVVESAPISVLGLDELQGKIHEQLNSLKHGEFLRTGGRARRGPPSAKTEKTKGWKKIKF